VWLLLFIGWGMSLQYFCMVQKISTHTYPVWVHKVIVARVLQTLWYLAKDIIVFHSAIVNADVDILVMMICKQERMIVHIAYMLVIDMPFVDTCKLCYPEIDLFLLNSFWCRVLLDTGRKRYPEIDIHWIESFLCNGLLNFYMAFSKECICCLILSSQLCIKQLCQNKCS